MRRHWLLALTILVPATHAQSFHRLRTASGEPTRTSAGGVTLAGNRVFGGVNGVSGDAAYWEVTSSGDPIAHVLPRRTYVHTASADGSWLIGHLNPPIDGLPRAWRCSPNETCEDLSPPERVEELTLNTTWDCSDDGRAILGVAMRLNDPEMYIALLRDGVLISSGITSPRVPILLSGDGRVAYIVGRAAPTAPRGLFKWTVDGEAVWLREFDSSIWPVQTSIDGDILYLMIGSQFYRYSDSEGFVAIERCCPGPILDITRDGRWAVGKESLITYSRPFIWDAVRGVRYLQDLVPGFGGRLSIGGETISDDGRVVTGISQGPYGWYVLLPDELPGADLNEDGAENGFDIETLAGLIAGGPNPRWLPTDFNRDGVADINDLFALEQVINGGN
ncbi:hypothetical protein PHYC_01064 [Phycisphaerales bacterium]|nr:hypothetical protein PHYC_01064 [Phycisphaerales bacterium]